MRVLLCVVVLLSLAAFASAGERFPTFSRASPLKPITLPIKYEKLPEVTLPTKMEKDVVQTQYIDQEIIQPKTIKQPLIQQRLVYQPIVRSRVLHQPIVRHVYSQNIIRPHVHSKETVRPVYQVQDVLVPKITTQDRVQEEFTKAHQQLQTQTMPASYQGKSRAQLYAPQPDYTATAEMGTAEMQVDNYD